MPQSCYSLHSRTMTPQNYSPHSRTMTPQNYYSLHSRTMTPQNYSPHSRTMTPQNYYSLHSRTMTPQNYYSPKCHHGRPARSPWCPSRSDRSYHCRCRLPCSSHHRLPLQWSHLRKVWFCCHWRSQSPNNWSRQHHLRHQHRLYHWCHWFRSHHPLHLRLYSPSGRCSGNLRWSRTGTPHRQAHRKVAQPGCYRR
jgi:hypothetical protein